MVVWTRKACDNPCCAEHPARLCHLQIGHDGDHVDRLGNRWLNQRSGLSR